MPVETVQLLVFEAIGDVDDRLPVVGPEPVVDPVDRVRDVFLDLLIGGDAGSALAPVLDVGEFAAPSGIDLPEPFERPQALDRKTSCRERVCLYV